VPHTPGFPVRVYGVGELHAAFLNESRTHGFVWGCVQEIRGISLVFREMWDTTTMSEQLLKNFANLPEM
jgi:hypothetical protein